MGNLEIMKNETSKKLNDKGPMYILPQMINWMADRNHKTRSF